MQNRDPSASRGLRGGLMVCGTASHAGKSTLVTGLCRSLARRGVRVAPFKAQNMALNSAVTSSGHEIGRAQAVQALAAGVEPEVAMNPILLKPMDERSSQVVVRGHPLRSMTAAEYHLMKPELLALVLDSLGDLRRRFDVVLCEGAGSAAEINLLDHDIVNLRLAHEAAMPAVVVADIDLGGAFASLFGTVELLPSHQRRLVRGFVVNKFRGDPALLLDGFEELERRCGVPTLGVMPWLSDTALDAEDSVALTAGWPSSAEAIADALDVAVVALPHMSNFTDLDPLAIEAGVRIRLVPSAGALGDPDLIVVPGTKSTVEDLRWMHERGLDAAIERADSTVLGICGGYQMLGTRITDGIESTRSEIEGLGLLPVTTRFEGSKVLRVCGGRAGDHDVDGYEIHHGRVTPHDGHPWIVLDGGSVAGICAGSVFGSTLHGLFEADGFRRAFLVGAAARRAKRFVPAGRSFRDVREQRLDALADAIDAHVDTRAIDALIESAASPSS